MRTTTDLRDIYPVVTGVLTDGAGTTYNLDGHCIPSGLPQFKWGTSQSGTFQVGGAVMGVCTFELMNAGGAFDSVTWKNSRVSFVLTCGTTAVNMGEYYIVNHSESGGNISVTAFDALKLLDSYEMHELTLTYPTTAGAVINAIAAFNGLTASGVGDASFAIADEIDGKMTMRQCVSYLAQCMCQFVQVKGTALVFDWYDMNAVTADGNTFGHDWGTSDVTITGVRVSDHDNSTSQDRGADGYRLEISGNPFITSSNASTVADAIWAGVNGITFRAGSAEISASPAFEAGDVVSVNTPDEAGVVLLLSNITYTPDVSMSITSDADAQEGDLNLNKSPYIKREDADQAITDALADPDSALSKALANAGGAAVIMNIFNGGGNMYVSSDRRYSQSFSYPSQVALPAGAYWQVQWTTALIGKKLKGGQNDSQTNAFTVRVYLKLFNATVDGVDHGGLGYVDLKIGKFDSQTYQNHFKIDYTYNPMFIIDHADGTQDRIPFRPARYRDTPATSDSTRFNYLAYADYADAWFFKTLNS